MTGTMSVLGVRAMSAALVARGVDVAAALARVGIDPAALADAEGRIELRHAFPFFAQVPELTGDPHFGLHAAALVPPGSLEALEYALRSCTTIGEALEQLARYYAVVDDRAALHVERQPARFTVVHTSPPQLDAPRPAKEFLFAYLFERGRAFTDAPFSVLGVRFRHPEPPDAAAQRAFFGAPVEYGAGVDALDLAHEVAAAPMRARDPGLSGVLGRVLDDMMQALETKDLLGDVKACIGTLLRRGAPSLDEVARAMSTSGRTLQRRLHESGTKFSDVVADVQRELSVAYLRERKLSVGEVAYLVGFSDTTSFHRAFRRWTGDTPSAVRRGSPS
jgi:AraC-like DNA-binding protein